MPGTDGLKVTEILRKEAPEIKVLILSVHNNKEYIFRVIQAGAHGYVSKEAPPDEVLRAIESVYQGNRSSARTSRARPLGVRHQRRQEGALCPAHPREREVLVSIAEGQSNKEIATSSASACAPSRPIASASCAAFALLMSLHGSDFHNRRQFYLDGASGCQSD